MIQILRNTCLMLVISSSAIAQQTVTTGVSSELAIHRRAEITDIRYQLDFTIPANKSESIQAAETIYLSLKTSTQPLQIDFKQPADHLHALT
ncbi:MAG TPA: aminopeptidase, partial [Niastella sp.]